MGVDIASLFGNGIKRIQSGTSAGSGSATITAVNVATSYIISKSKASAGTVQGSGSLALSLATTGRTFTDLSSAIAGASSTSPSFTGGTTALTTKEYSAVLTNSTTVTYDGAVEWQVIEFYQATSAAALGGAFGGVIKSVQSGTSSGSGSATISAVSSKAYIISTSKGSTGTAAVRGGWTYSPVVGGFRDSTAGNNQDVNANGTYNVSLSGGTTDLTTKHYTATLTNSTTVTYDGPVEWQVIDPF